jgi:hypothetical protein
MTQTDPFAGQDVPKISEIVYSYNQFLPILLLSHESYVCSLRV